VDRLATQAAPDRPTELSRYELSNRGPNDLICGELSACPDRPAVTDPGSGGHRGGATAFSRYPDGAGAATGRSGPGSPVDRKWVLHPEKCSQAANCANRRKGSWGDLSDVARMQRSGIREADGNNPGLRCAPSRLRSQRTMRPHRIRLMSQRKKTNACSQSSLHPAGEWLSHDNDLINLRTLCVICGQYPNLGSPAGLAAITDAGFNGAPEPTNARTGRSPWPRINPSTPPRPR